ncbi:MAG: nickel transporter [Actinomycetota bacterium]|nr:nickel transporter [Actinomycetota bacterium]
MKRRIASAMLGTVAAGAFAAIAMAPVASAHPLGNFTHNTYVGFAISPDRIQADHVLDLAEIPSFQARSGMDANGDGSPSAAESQAWADARCLAAASQIKASTDLGAVNWSVGKSTITFPQGQAGLSTTRLVCAYEAAIADASSFSAVVSIEEGRTGWHEITARGEGVRLSADVPTTSTSARLTAYPVDASPADFTTVQARWNGAAPVAAGTTTQEVQAPAPAVESTTAAAATTIAPFGLDGPTQAFTNLISEQDLTVGFGLLALLIAIGLGGLHALAPGHGKTLMAASLIGTNGRKRDAVVLGASVTTAHTAGVVALALVLSISSAFAAESTYPWLGLFSAVLAIGVGVSLLRQARRGGGLGHHHGLGGGHSHGTHAHVHHDHDDHHDHGSDHPHPHDESPHPHPHAHPHEQTAGSLALATSVSAAPAVTTTPRNRRIIALGLAGGMVPSPSAVVILLAGFALGRAWFALLLVLAYGIGMALTLCFTGLLLVHAGNLSERVVAGTAVPRPVAAVLKHLPLIAAITVVAAGIWLAVRSLVAL